MQRHHGSRARRPLAALVTALGLLAMALVGFIGVQSARATDAVVVTIYGSSGSSIVQSATVYDGAPFYFHVQSDVNAPVGVLVCGAGFPTAVAACKGGNGQVVRVNGNSVELSLPAGGYTYKWSNNGGLLSFHSANLAVRKTPPPPPTSTPAGGSTTPTSPGGGTSGVPSGSTGPSGSGSSSGIPTTSTSASGSSTPGGGGISIGPGGVITTTTTIPLGFGAPLPDNPTPTIPNPIGSGVGTVPTGGPATGTPSQGTSQQTLVELASTSPASKNRPTSLAIVSIGALAIVSSLYAYRRLGEQGQRAGR